MSQINDRIDILNKLLYENTEYVFSAITELIVSLKLRNKYLRELEEFYYNNKERLYKVDIKDFNSLVEDHKTEVDINILLEMKKLMEDKRERSCGIIKEMKNSINGWD